MVSLVLPIWPCCGEIGWDSASLFSCTVIYSLPVHRSSFGESAFFISCGHLSVAILSYQRLTLVWRGAGHPLPPPLPLPRGTRLATLPGHLYIHLIWKSSVVSLSQCIANGALIMTALKVTAIPTPPIPPPVPCTPAPVSPPQHPRCTPHPLQSDHPVPPRPLSTTHGVRAQLIGGRFGLDPSLIMLVFLRVPDSSEWSDKVDDKGVCDFSWVLGRAEGRGRAGVPALVPQPPTPQATKFTP